PVSIPRRLPLQPRVRSRARALRICSTAVWMGQRIGLSALAPFGLLPEPGPFRMGADDDVAGELFDSVDAGTQIRRGVRVARIAAVSEIVRRDRVQAIGVHHIETALP